MLPQVSAADLHEFLRAHADQAPWVLDVREPWELARARLGRAGTTVINIPMQSLPQRAAELPSTQPILVLCHHGMRSMQCVAWLQRHGHQHVYNIAGGIDAYARLVDSSVPLY